MNYHRKDVFDHVCYQGVPQSRLQRERWTLRTFYWLQELEQDRDKKGTSTVRTTLMIYLINYKVNESFLCLK